MKKRIILSLTVVIVIALFVVIKVSTGRELDEQALMENALSETYMERGKIISESTDKAKPDSDALRKSLEQSTDDEVIENSTETIRDNLNYAMEHFDKLDQRSEIQVVAQTRYVLRYLYSLVVYSDYDQTVHTKKEGLLWKTLVHQYVNVASSYVGDIESGNQEKADLLKAQALARKLSGSFDEEIDNYVKALVEVIKEEQAR